MSTGITERDIRELGSPDQAVRAAAEERIRQAIAGQIDGWSADSFRARARGYAFLRDQKVENHLPALAEMTVQAFFRRVRRDQKRQPLQDTGVEATGQGNKAFKFVSHHETIKFIRTINANVVRDYVDALVRGFKPSEGVELPEDEWFRALEDRYDIENPEDLVIFTQLMQAIQGFIAQQANEQRKLFRMRHEEGYTFERIAECLGVSVSCAKAWHRKLMGALGRYLADKGFGMNGRNGDD
jgi:DNA-directed RNA polymerase specialized sigma24 family protein